MKIRFLAFLAAVAVGSAAVLIYAAQTKEKSSASLSGAEDCSACEMSATKPDVAAKVQSTDGCCLNEAAKPAVATLDGTGCPADAARTANTKLTAVESAAVEVTPKSEACCASEGAAAAPAKVE